MGVHFALLGDFLAAREIPDAIAAHVSTTTRNLECLVFQARVRRPDSRIAAANKDIMLRALVDELAAANLKVCDHCGLIEVCKPAEIRTKRQRNTDTPDPESISI
jgi:hypothetical protein